MSQSPSCLTSAECVALAEKLQDVAQVLLSIATAQTPDISRELPSNNPLLDIPSESTANTPLLDIPSELPPKNPTNRSDVRSVGAGEVHSFSTGESRLFDSDEVHSFDSGDVPSFGTGEARSFDTGKAHSFSTDEVHSVGAGDMRSFDTGEVRSFFFPAPAIQLEKELLSKHRVNDFQGLLKEANLQLIGLVKLMQSVHKDTRFRGYIIASLGSQISHTSALLLRMRTIYDKVLPVQIDKK